MARTPRKNRKVKEEDDEIVVAQPDVGDGDYRLTPRQLLYAQARAKGLSIQQAAVFANISRPTGENYEKKQVIIDKIEQIINERANGPQVPTIVIQGGNEEEGPTPKQVAEGVGADATWVIAHFKRIAEEALANSSYAAANSALREISEILGLKHKPVAPPKDEDTKPPSEDQYLNTFKAMLDAFNIQDEPSPENVPVPGITDGANND